MGILAVGGLSAAPVFLGFLMEPWLPLGHWGWGGMLFLALLPSAIYWRKKIFGSVQKIWQWAQKIPLKTIAEGPTEIKVQTKAENGWVDEDGAPPL